MVNTIENNLIFITGTDTGIGKTVVSLLLLRYFYAQKMTPFYLKPFQTGCRDARDQASDAAFIYRNIKTLKAEDPRHSVIYCHTQPKAPYFAAREQNKEIDFSETVSRIASYRSTEAPVVIEGSGGLVVPLTRNKSIIDLIEALRAAPVLVARAGLGTINHTLLSVEALRQRGLEPVGIVFVDESASSAPSDLVRENMEAIKTASGIRVSGVIGKIEDFSEPPENCLTVIADLVSKL